MVVRMHKTELQVASQIICFIDLFPLIGLDRPKAWYAAVELISETAAPSTMKT
jgi:hypothetical protein